MDFACDDVRFFISGYGMTKGIMDAKLALRLHDTYLPALALISFTIHTSYAIRLAFKRWGVWNGFSKFVLTVFYAVFLVGFLFIELFYVKSTKPKSGTGGTSSNVSQNVVPNTPDNSVNTGATTFFTLAELAKYDGQNGQAAYVAVDGAVYDLSSIFTDGSHFSHFAGQELTSEFYSRHGSYQITKYPVVGKLQ